MIHSHEHLSPEPRKPVIPDYTLLRFIGSGAYGDVWLARCITGSLRALKIVYRDRFEDHRPFDREVEGIRRFDPVSRQDEALIALFHVGQNTSEGFFYYVMELADDCSGSAEISPETYAPKTLDRILKTQGRLPIEQSIELGISLSKALSCLHRNELVHRDVKTSNVVYVNGRAKLADMGMVSRVIDSHSFVGTEGFIAPEGPGTPQADVFALGKVLYEAAMGMDRKAFPALPDEINTWQEAEKLHEFNEVLLKACQNDPKKRHESASDLYADLACLLSGKSIRKLRALERRLAQLKQAAVWVALLALFAALGTVELVRERGRRAEARARELGTHVGRALQLIDSGKLIQALPPLMEASSLEEKQSRQLNRTRLSWVLDQVPKLSQFWSNSKETRDGEFSRDGKLIVVATRNGGVRVRDFESGKFLSKPFGPTFEIETASFDPTGDHVLIASQDKTVSVWDWRIPKRELCFTNAEFLLTAQFNHKGDLFATGGKDGCVRIHNSRTGELITTIRAHSDAISWIVFSHDDRYIASAGHDKTAQVWTVADGERAGPSLPHGNWAMCADFSPDDSALATASADYKGAVWDWRTGHLLFPKLDHQAGVCSIEFSPDGRLILTTSWDMTARLWLAASGKPFEPCPILPHSGKVLHGAFAPDGRRFLTS